MRSTFFLGWGKWLICFIHIQFIFHGECENTNLVRISCTPSLQGTFSERSLKVIKVIKKCFWSDLKCISIISYIIAKRY